MLFSCYLFSQAKYDIKGSLINKENQPLENIIIKLYNENEFHNTISNINGEFSFTDLKPSNYTIEIISIFTEDYINNIVLDKNYILDKIILSEKNNNLEEIIVSSKYKPVIQKNEGTVLNVENSDLKNKDNALSIIKYAPSVSTNNGIQIFGNDEVEIQLNGRTLNIEKGKNAIFLSSLKASNIKKIEIIDKPSSSLQGNKIGYINIITKNNNGLTGYFSTAVQYNSFFGNTNDGSLFYSNNKFRLYSMAYISNHKTNYNAINSQATENLSYNSLESGELIRVEKNFILGGDYYFNEKESISFIYDNTQDNDKNHKRNILTNIYPVTSYNTISSNNNIDQFDKTNTFSINYEKKLDTLNSNINVLLDYANNNYKNPIHQTNNYFLDNIQTNIFSNQQYDNSTNNIYSLAFNLKKYSINKNELAIGSKVSYIKNNFNYQYFDEINENQVINDSYSNKFYFNQYLYSIFTNYTMNKNKSNYSFGVRMEYNDNKYNNIITSGQSNNFFLLPTYLHSIKINDNNKFYYYLTKRITRPTNNSFNPTYIQNSPINGSIGNNNLNTTELLRFQTGYTYKNKYKLDFQYNYIENNVFVLPTLNNNVFVSNFLNGGYRNNYHFFLTIPIKVGNWWEINNKINFAYFDFKYFESNYQSWYNNIEIYNTFQLPQNIELETNYSFTSNYKSLYINNKYVNNLNFTVNYPINKNWKINLGINDIFNSIRNSLSYQFNNINNYTFKKFNTRSAFFSISYNFSTGKEVNDTTKKSNIEEEKSRLR